MRLNWKLAGILTIVALGLAGSSASAQTCESCGDGSSDCKKCNRCCRCMPIPEEECQDCDDMCHRCRLPALCGSGKADELIHQLESGCCKERIKAAKKLGCPLCVNICKCNGVLDALIHSLLCDTCWEVRAAAAWALALQKARTEQAVIALYVAARLDPHYMVRDSATESLSVILAGHANCFKEQRAAVDPLIRQLKGKYNPTKGDCMDLPNLLSHSCAAGPAMTSAPPMEMVPAPKPEAVPAPKEKDKLQ